MPLSERGHAEVRTQAVGCHYGQRMRDELSDKGPDSTGLRAMAYALGVIASGSLMRLLIHAGNDSRVQAELFVWLLIGALAIKKSVTLAATMAMTANTIATLPMPRVLWWQRATRPSDSAMTAPR